MSTIAMRLTLCGVVFATALAPRVQAGDGEPRTRITDPETLASMGFPKDAKSVYGYVSRLNQPPRADGEPEGYFGGTASGFSTYDGQDFSPRINTPGTNPAGWWVNSTYGDLFRTAGDPNYEVRLDIPNGARLQGLRWWAFDSDTVNDIQFRIVQMCLPNQGAGAPTFTVLATQSTLGSSGDQSQEMTINQTVDTKVCTYRIQVSLPTPSQANILYRVRAQWVRQVSAAPVTARFLDIPTTHPFFRFVEALASSGITGGCSANQYCPDTPVTRGQMAVFLATALGLNWGGL